MVVFESRRGGFRMNLIPTFGITDDSCKHVHKDSPEGSKCEECYKLLQIVTNSPQVNSKDAKLDSVLTNPADTSTLSDKIFTANNKSKTFIELHNLEIILREFIKKLNEGLDNFIFPACDKCGASFCIHVKERFKIEIIDKLAGPELVGEEN